ncbi:MAG: YHS domain-containing protein [Anaerolineales bacterium]
MVTDPVCGMQVDPNKPGATSEYQGQTIFFCSPGCKADFDKDPEKYMQGNKSQQDHSGH